MRLLSNPDIADAQLLHSAMSFLKNLAIPVQNKPLLGSLLDVGCIPRLLSLDTSPQVQFTAVSLTRLLVVNCPPNVARMCAPLSADPASPARERSSVHGIITLYERSDAEPTRLEAARAVAAICRVLHSNPVAPLLPDWEPPVVEIEADSSDSGLVEAESQRLEYFYSNHDVARVLSFLVSQQKWPSLRSEAWFIFALMCRSKEGGRVIITLLQIHGTMTELIKAVTGRDAPLSEVGSSDDIEGALSSASAPDDQITSMADGLGLEPQQADPKQRESMIRVDRENALVMCTELLRTWGNQLPGLRLSILQDLVKEGTEIVAAQKAATS